MEYKSLDTTVVVTVVSLVINIERRAGFSGWAKPSAPKVQYCAPGRKDIKFQKKGQLQWFFYRELKTNTQTKNQPVRKNMCILKNSFHVFALIYFSLAPLPVIRLFPSRKQVTTLVSAHLTSEAAK